MNSENQSGKNTILLTVRGLKASKPHNYKPKNLTRALKNFRNHQISYSSSNGRRSVNIAKKSWRKFGVNKLTQRMTHLKAKADNYVRKKR